MRRATLSALALCSTLAMAQEPVDVTGGITATVQAADETDTEALGSFDLFVTVPQGRGSWTVYVEGSTAPREGGVAEAYPEANADAGTALAADGSGNVQVSELKYRHDLDAVAITAGVVNTTAYMDFAVTANDENGQFLGANLVNNGVIEFPDYVPGLVFEIPLDADGSQVFLLLTGSHGLSENSAVSYSELFELDAEDKGAFVAAGVRWLGEGLLEIGAWANTATHVEFDSDDEASNYGVYANLGRRAGHHAADLRLGVANEEVSEAAAFASLSYAYAWDPVTFGIGAAYVMLSDQVDDTARDDLSQAEAYLSFPVVDGLTGSLHLQYLENPGFDAEVEAATITALRLNYAF
jgi:hypothetical protein